MSQFFKITKAYPITTTLIAGGAGVATNTSTSRKSVHSVKVNNIRVVSNTGATDNKIKVELKRKAGSPSKTRTINGAVSSSTRIVLDQENNISPTDKIKVRDDIRITSESASITAHVSALNPDGDNSKEIEVLPAAGSTVTLNDGLTLVFTEPNFVIIPETAIPSKSSFVLDIPFSFNKITHELVATATGSSIDLTIIVD